MEADGKTDPGKSQSVHHLEVDNHAPSIPEVKKVGYSEFKNRTSKDDARYAVVVLVSGPLLDQEIQQELQDRSGKTTAKAKGKSVKNKASDAGAGVSILDKALHNHRSDDKWVQRVRVQSPALLTILGKLCGESWSLRPRTFWRPFKLLIHCHRRLHQVLNELEIKYGAAETLTPLPDGISTPSKSVDEPTRLERPQSLDDSIEALKDLRCLCKLIDEEIGFLKYPIII